MSAVKIHGPNMMVKDKSRGKTNTVIQKMFHGTANPNQNGTKKHQQLGSNIRFIHGPHKQPQHRMSNGNIFHKNSTLGTTFFYINGWQVAF